MALARKRKARAAQALTGTPYKAALNAIDADQLPSLTDDPERRAALAAISAGDPVDAVPALVAALLDDHDITAASNPRITGHPRVSLRMGRTIVDVLLDPSDLTDATVVVHGRGTPVAFSVPDGLADPLSIAGRIADRLDHLIGLWDESGLVAA
jgi:hypothetical protein